MEEPQPIGERVRAFEDLALASDELLRQVATRVHIIDLAYAFATADEAVRERLLRSVRPGLAEQITSAIRAMETTDARMPSADQVRLARARVMEVARTEAPPEGAQDSRQ
jgi:flagellar motor switch protein FliG